MWPEQRLETESCANRIFEALLCVNGTWHAFIFFWQISSEFPSDSGESTMDRSALRLISTSVTKRFLTFFVSLLATETLQTSREKTQ